MFWQAFSFLSLLFATLGDRNVIRDKNINITFRCLFVLSLAYVVGFCGVVATDHYTYVQKYLMYSNVNSFSELLKTMDFGIFYSEREMNDETTSIGMAIFNYICAKIGIGVVTYFLIIAIITNSLLVKVLYRYSLPTLSVLIFITSTYFFQEMNLVRQYIAVSIFVYSLRFVKEKNLEKYSICILLAFLFHYSSMYLFPLYYLNRIRKGISLSFIVRIIPISLWVVSLFIALNIIKIETLDFVAVTNYYENYFENRDEKLSFDLMFNLLTLYLLYHIYITKKIEVSIDTILYVLGVSLLNVSIQYYMIFRFALFFNYINCIMVGDVLWTNNIRDKIFRRFCIILVVLVFFYFGRRLIFDFILNDKVLIGSEFYSLNDLIQ